MPKFGIDRACAPLGAIETALAFTDGGYLDDMGKVQQLFQSHRRFHWIENNWWINSDVITDAIGIDLEIDIDRLLINQNYW